MRPRSTALRTLNVLVVCAMSVIQAESHAALVNTSSVVEFELGKTGFWGPNSGVASFGSSAFLGSHALGVSYAAKASSGEVSGAVSGVIGTRYSNFALYGEPWSARFQLNGLNQGGALDTFLGARIDVIGHALGGDVCIYCLDKSLAVDLNFTPVVNKLETASASVTAASPGVGANFGVGSVRAGVDLSVEQDIHFKELGVQGKARARHQVTGTQVDFQLNFGAEGDQEFISFRPTKKGIWEIQLLELQLLNEFSTDFALDIAPFVSFTVGGGCGNPGSNRDNGWFCIADDKAVYHLADVPLFTGTPFALPFSRENMPAFNVLVVPEPTPITLLCSLGIFGIAGRNLALRRSRLRSRATVARGV